MEKPSKTRPHKVVAGQVTDVFIDDIAKLNDDAFVGQSQVELNRMVVELNRIEEEYMKSVSLWDRLLNVRFPVNFTNPKTLVVSLGAFASIAGMLSGLDQSIISGATPGINAALHPTDHENSLISSLMPLGAMAGSMLIPLHSHFLGRRMSTVIACIWYTVGGGICAGSRSVHMLYGGRFCLGMGIGIEGCVGIYISECVPPEKRGSLVSLYQFMLALGELVGYACCAVFFDVHGGWRFMLGSSIVFSTILLVGLFLFPESPRWLVSKNQIGRAWSIWKSMRDIDDPKNLIEFLDMHETAKLEDLESKEEKVWQRYFELITIPRNRRALFYSLIMTMLGQMTGVNAILYNMSTLLTKMNFDDRQSVLMSMVGGGALFLGTIPAILWMDKYGRQVWAQLLAFAFIGLVLVGAGYEIPYEVHKQAALGVYFTGMIMYMGFFGTYSCVSWVISTEVFNLRTRAQGMAISSASLFFWSFIVTYFFDQMQRAMTYTGLCIGFYGGIAFLGYIYQILFMVETKNKTLEELDMVFNMRTKTLVAHNIRSIAYWVGRLFGRRTADKLFKNKLGSTDISSGEDEQEGGGLVVLNA